MAEPPTSASALHVQRGLELGINRSYARQHLKRHMLMFLWWPHAAAYSCLLVAAELLLLAQEFNSQQQ